MPPGGRPDFAAVRDQAMAKWQQIPPERQNIVRQALNPEAIMVISEVMGPESAEMLAMMDQAPAAPTSAGAAGPPAGAVPGRNPLANVTA